jgi:hypothetical protein
MKPNIPLTASCVLAWLPKGTTVVPSNLGPADLEAWWQVADAARAAATRARKEPDREPWIKVGDQILGPKEVLGLSKSIGTPNWSR